KTHTRTELMVILTPHVIRNKIDSDRILNEEIARTKLDLSKIANTHGHGLDVMLPSSAGGNGNCPPGFLGTTITGQPSPATPLAAPRTVPDAPAKPATPMPPAQNGPVGPTPVTPPDAQQSQILAPVNATPVQQTSAATPVPSTNPGKES